MFLGKLLIVWLEYDDVFFILPTYVILLYLASSSFTKGE